MRLPLTRLENIADYNNNPLTLSPSSLLLIVRLVGYIVNLCVFYSHRFIEKLTAFLQFQEFILRNQIQRDVVTLTLTGYLSLQEHTLTHHTRKPLVCQPRPYLNTESLSWLQVFQSPDQPSVYETCRPLSFTF
jgi:hypothetical protein